MKHAIAAICWAIIRLISTLVTVLIVRQKSYLQQKISDALLKKICSEEESSGKMKYHVAGFASGICWLRCLP